MTRDPVRISENEIKLQQGNIEKIRESISAQNPLAFVDTYGCQQNEADSEKLRGMLREMGYGFTDLEAEADVIVINTCAIREHAEQRVWGNIGALVHTKRLKPEQIIALVGCMVQQPQAAEKIRKSYRHVDLVFGPHALWRFPEFLLRILEERGRIFETDDSVGAIAEGLPQQRDGSVKAWLSVMYGCNNFCSYCIVPYVRGRERSRQPQDILKEAEDIVASGFREITLLGQNVNSYGKDLADGIDFSELLKEINDIPGDFLIRFMTSHPKDASIRLFETMMECEKVAKHIHLPFQAGSDSILRAMNRGYTKSGYLELIRAAREFMPDIVITSDVIVGFPGETEEEFGETLGLIEEVGFDALFTFIYSRRKGTPAAELYDPVPREEKQKWFDRLLDVQNRVSAQKHGAYVGKTLKVLVDGVSEDERFDLTSRTNGGRLVKLRGESPVGRFTEALITDSSTWSLMGEILNYTNSN